MLHIVKMIRRRYPEHATTIVPAVVLASGGAPLLGVGLLFLS